LASGLCPILLFRVQDRDVFTLLGTDYSKGNCKDVRNGAEVAVEGVQMSDGQVRADKVTIKKKARDRDDDDDDDDDDNDLQDQR
jgi:hypothetical protein